MANPQPMSIVFRIPAVSISRDALEATFGMPLDRFEHSKVSPLSYAQIDVPEDGDAWASAATMADRLGPAISNLIERGEVGQPTGDIAMPFLEGHMTVSLLIPNAVALALARWGFQIEVSVYLTRAD